MSKYIKNAAKETAKLGKSGIKLAVQTVLAEIATEVMQETGAADIAKEKIMDIGLAIIRNSGLDVKNLKKEALKMAIQKELNL